MTSRAMAHAGLAQHRALGRRQVADMVRLLFFGMLADRFGRTREISVTDNLRTVGDLIARLKSECPGDGAVLDQAAVKVSVNARIASRDTAITDADESGFMPPFSGG